MAGDIGIVGRQILLTVGTQSILGVQTKGLTANNERLDTTDDNSDGWASAMAIAGQKSLELSMSGLLKNLELLAAYFNNSQMFEATITYPDGSTATGSFFLDSFSHTGEYNGLATFDASLSSSGEVTFTAGI